MPVIWSHRYPRASIMESPAASVDKDQKAATTARSDRAAMIRSLSFVEPR